MRLHVVSATNTLLLTLLLVLGSFKAALAQVMVYVHDGEPAFSLVYPNGWQIRTPRKEGKQLISAMPADGNLLWQGVWIVREARTKDEAFDRLKSMERRLFHEAALTHEPRAYEIGALAVSCHEGAGKYKEETKVRFVMCVFELPEDRVGALAMMGDPNAIDMYRDDLNAIVNSLEVVER